MVVSAASNAGDEDSLGKSFSGRGVWGCERMHCITQQCTNRETERGRRRKTHA
jgi:hypothetical protein